MLEQTAQLQALRPDAQAAMTKVQAAQPGKLMEPQVKHLQPVIAEVKVSKIGQVVQNLDCLRIEPNLVMRQAQHANVR
ncbi:hypothetical protein D3C76_1597830 [compost metagenome]